MEPLGLLEAAPGRLSTVPSMSALSLRGKTGFPPSPHRTGTTAPEPRPSRTDGSQGPSGESRSSHLLQPPRLALIILPRSLVCSARWLRLDLNLPGDENFAEAIQHSIRHVDLDVDSFQRTSPQEVECG